MPEDSTAMPNPQPERRQSPVTLRNANERDCCEAPAFRQVVLVPAPLDILMV